MTSTSNPVTPSDLDYNGSALAALDELATAQENIELLYKCHLMWCGPSCAKDIACQFFHYRRSEPLSAQPRTVRSRYNKETAHLYSLMGGDGYVPGTSRIHEVNTWPLLEAILEKIDAARGRNRLLHCDYTDWSKKRYRTAEILTRSICRDVIQWMGNWCGADYAASLAGLHYVAFTTIVDDICIPPLDLVHGNLCIYGRSLGDLIQDMVNRGWDCDATRVLLSLVRQYLLQYAEKFDFDQDSGSIGLEAALSQTSGIWDSTVYRTHTANTYGVAIVVGRVTGSGPLTSEWLFDSAICDAISMDLAKSAMRIYELDDHIPTTVWATHDQRQQVQALERQRQAGYHSVYLDLIDDLVRSGAPDSIVHFGRAGLLFVQMQDRYLERRAGRQFPIRPAMARQLHKLFGDTPTNAWLDGLYCLKQLAQSGPLCLAQLENNQAPLPLLAPNLLSACQKRQQRRKQSYSPGNTFDLHGPTNNTDVLACICALHWIDVVHLMAQKAKDQSDLQDLLAAGEELGGLTLSKGQLEEVGSLENLWALCMSCQLDCGDDCEWLSFAQHVWEHCLAALHRFWGCRVVEAECSRSDLGEPMAALFASAE